MAVEAAVTARNPIPALQARWRRWWRPHRSVLERTVRLDAWFPQVPIALALAPLGFLVLDAAIRSALDLGPLSMAIGDIERGIEDLHIGVTARIASGLFLIAMSIGILLRSRLAWLATVAVLTVGLAVRLPLPGRPVEIPVLLYVAGVLALLWIHRAPFVSRSVVSSAVFSAVALVTFLLWATLGTLRLGSHFHPPVTDLGTAFYVAVVTVSSVGFGDIVPSDTESRLFVVTMIVLGLIVGATSVSAIIVPLVGGRLRAVLGGEEEKVERSKHYVVAGRSSLARNATLELEKRGQRVTLVLPAAVDEAFFRERDVVIGDPTDLEVLRSAGVLEAMGVLALSTDDAENGFIVLGVNELDPNIRTVAALNDPGNQSRLLRTQPSLLLSLQVLGGELLAMALTGERVDESILGRFLQLAGSEGAKPE